MTIEILQTVVIAIIGFILAVWIITYPFLGIVLVAASLPITDLLPSVPFLYPAGVWRPFYAWVSTSKPEKTR